MKDILKLNTGTLSSLPEEVKIPAYDRSKLRCGIAHIGVGGFHRAHEAYYTDQVLNSGNSTDWGICGISLLDADSKIYNALSDQDGLYTLMITGSDGKLTARIIGSMVEHLYAPGNPKAVLEKLASPEIKIISLTITEGGYNFNSATGEFLIAEPAIQHDLKNPDDPKTVFGYLARGLKLRRDRNIGGLTIQSCDNIQKNGDVLKKMLLSYVIEAEPGMTGWIEQHVTFPNSMVDRITPVTTSSDIELLKSTFGIEDKWPVVCEPFIQWIIEDNYSNGKPDWGSAGVRFVKDVGPYEKMKIRLLNAGHSLLGFIGTLSGCLTIDEAVSVPLFRKFLRDFMDQEVTPLLGKIEGINMEDYKDTLIGRFGNIHIKDQLTRICSESSSKIPKFLMPTIEEQLERDGSIKRGALVVAAWCRYLELAGTQGYNYDITDKMAAVLQENALASINADPLAFLKTSDIFGDLVHSRRFVDTYLTIIDDIRTFGLEEAIRKTDQSDI